MKRASLALRLIRSTFFAVISMGLIFGIIAWQLISQHVNSAVEREAEQLAQDAIGKLGSIDDLSRAQVASSMRVLQDQGQRVGAPSVAGQATLGDKSVPDLHLGKNSTVLNYEVVDRVKELAGGTATLFVRDGANFVRVSTNVKKPDGTRAVGTLLDAKGKAYAALSEGNSFSGVVDILGSPYITSYVPMKDAGGATVGAWYVGYKLDSIAAVGKSIQEAHLLDHGFLALIKPSGEVVYYGEQTTVDEVQKLRKNPEHWVVRETRFPSWNYTILSAYPRLDVTARMMSTAVYLLLGAALLVGLILVMQFVLLNRQILAPVRYLTARLMDADLNTLLEVERNDEVGDLANGFNRFVLRIRHALLQVRDGSVAASTKSAEIRTIAHAAGSRAEGQQQSAQDASHHAERLSTEIGRTSIHTDEASEHARAAANAAQEGTQLVNSAAAMIAELSAETQSSAERVSTLAERAKQIGSIVTVIEEIAAGTNLLALNASIEAARAGEHGRGFAVVAGEVRRLAERTAQATHQVASLVSGIEEETDRATSGILNACQRASQGAEAVGQLSGNFNRIAQMVTEVDNRMTQVASGAHQEERDAKELSQTMRQLSNSAKESASGAGTVVSAAEHLDATAHQLESLVRGFELRELPQDQNS